MIIRDTDVMVSDKIYLFADFIRIPDIVLIRNGYELTLST